MNHPTVISGGASLCHTLRLCPFWGGDLEGLGALGGGLERSGRLLFPVGDDSVLPQPTPQIYLQNRVVGHICSLMQYLGWGKKQAT